MPWQPEDWNEWLVDASPASPAAAAHVRALHGILRRLPAPFSRVFSIDSDTDLLESPVSRERCDVVVAVDSIQPPTVSELDLILERVRTALREGGVFLASFPATCLGGRPVYLPLRSADGTEPPTFHEVALQYRLRRAGFQGLRVLRFRQGSEGCDFILCMAVRRASN